jgi:hypothetical protein
VTRSVAQCEEVLASLSCFSGVKDFSDTENRGVQAVQVAEDTLSTFHEKTFTVFSLETG